MTSAPTPAYPPVIPLASIGRRAGALVIDLAIGSVITYGVLAILIGLGISASQAGNVMLSVGVSSSLYWVILVTSLGWWLLFSWLQTKKGSPGQRATRIRLQAAPTGLPLSLGAAFGRNVLFSVLASFLIGFFTPLFDSRLRQGWHDKIVDAVMIDTRAVASVVTAAPATAPLVTTSAAATPVEPATPIGGSPPDPEQAAAIPTVLAGSGVISRAPFGSPESPPALPTAPPAIPPLPPVPQFERPAPAAPAAGAAGGLVSEVPGVHRPRPEEGETIWTVPPVGSAAPTPPDVAQPVEEDVDLTRHVPAAPPRRTVTLVWDDGTRKRITGPTVFGRNPDPAADYEAVAVVDDTRSLSKTHFELGLEAGGLWLVDRHSTNGTAIDSPGSPRRAAVPGEKTTVGLGDTVVIGDRTFTLQEIE